MKLFVQGLKERDESEGDTPEKQAARDRISKWKIVVKGAKP